MAVAVWAEDENCRDRIILHHQYMAITATWIPATITTWILQLFQQQVVPVVQWPFQLWMINHLCRPVIRHTHRTRRPTTPSTPRMDLLLRTIIPAITTDFNIAPEMTLLSIHLSRRICRFQRTLHPFTAHRRGNLLLAAFQIRLISFPIYDTVHELPRTMKIIPNAFLCILAIY